jgi:hypothetical protein
MDDKSKNVSGRTPPPVEYRFLKGSSGNKRGRPKGAVSLKKLIRKVALKKHRVVVEGRVLRKTLLELVIEVMIRGAASGAPSMASLHNEIRSKVRPQESVEQGGLLVVPEPLSREEWTAQAEERNAQAPDDPTDYVDHKVEEFCKAVRGVRTPLGEAILASHRRWGTRAAAAAAAAAK